MIQNFKLVCMHKIWWVWLIAWGKSRCFLTSELYTPLGGVLILSWGSSHCGWTKTPTVTETERVQKSCAQRWHKCLSLSGACVARTTLTSRQRTYWTQSISCPHGCYLSLGSLTVRSTTSTKNPVWYEIMGATIPNGNCSAQNYNCVAFCCALYRGYIGVMSQYKPLIGLWWLMRITADIILISTPPLPPRYWCHCYQVQKINYVSVKLKVICINLTIANLWLSPHWPQLLLQILPCALPFWFSVTQVSVVVVSLMNEETHKVVIHSNHSTATREHL